MVSFSQMLVISSIGAAASMKCPGSGAWLPHAKTQVTATVKGSCADVKAELEARTSGQNGWVDPHNGGVYSTLSSSDSQVATKRTTNPKHSVGGQVYTDKQIFTLTTNGDSCDVAACSESQGASLKDFSTNYCDIRNLYCGSADGCKTVLHDFSSTQDSVIASSGQSDWSACIVKTPVTFLSAAASNGCPGSGAWLPHAKTQVAATAKASCADVKAEIEARTSGQNGWVDPHNGGIYSILSSSDAQVATKRTTNPKHSVGGQVYTDKQIFTLAANGDSCDISACSESQGASLKDFSTNYCDIRNLYCGSADGCKTVKHDFPSSQSSVTASSGQSDFSACIVAAVTV